MSGCGRNTGARFRRSASTQRPSAAHSPSLLQGNATVSLLQEGCPIATAAPTPLRDHCLAPERVDAPLSEGGRYGRMFDLPTLKADDQLLHRTGAAGGFCDGGDCDDDSSVEAGWPFFGQYVAHDLTADRSPLREHADVAALANMRSPRANLESLYGGGPGGSPYMYRSADPAKLLEGEGDLPR